MTAKKLLGLLLFGFVLTLEPINNEALAKTLKIARTAIPPSRGIPFTGVSQPGIGIWSLIYDALTRIDNQGNLEASLAVAWEAASPTKWIFYLRPNVLFQNGEPFNAAAVIESIALLKTKEGARFYTASEVVNIIGVEAQDPLTVVIETAKPDPIMPRRANLLWVLPPIALANRGVESFSQNPVGTGPFRLIDWGDVTGAVSLDAFNDSWRASPDIEHLNIYAMQDSVTRIQALRSGQVNVAEQIGFDDLKLLEGEGFKTYSRRVPVVSGIAFRVIGNELSPVSDRRVRQAMNLAINREFLVNNLFRGTAVATGQGAVPFVNGYNPDVVPWPFDPERASQLLKDAEYDFDRTLKIQVATGISGGDTLLFEFVAQSLRAIGIKIDLRSIPYAKWLTSFTNNDWGDVDAFSLAWDNSAYYDAIRAETYSGCYKAQPFFCAPATRPILEAISVEMDLERRTQMLQNLMVMQQEIAPAIWLVSGTGYVASGNDVRGLKITSRGIPYESIRLGAKH